jgi:transposase
MATALPAELIDEQVRIIEPLICCQPDPEPVDSDQMTETLPIRQFLKDQEIHSCIPHRWHEELKNEVDRKYYQGRRHVERTFAWIANFRHPVLRCEKKVALFPGFLYLAASLICLRSSVSI